MVLSCWRAPKAGGSAAFLSTIITRGRIVWLARSTFRKNGSAASASRVALNMKSSVAPAEVDSPIEIIPRLLDLDGRFIPAVRIGGCTQRGPTAYIQLRGVVLHPAKHGLARCSRSAAIPATEPKISRFFLGS